MYQGLLILGVLAGCGQPEPTPPPAAQTEAAPETAAQARSAAPAARPDRIAVRHVLVTYTGSSGAGFGVVRTRKEARKRAEQVLERLARGEAFEDLARALSDDGSKARGGFLGSGEQGTWVPAFEAAAFALQVGEVSGIVETPFGFHVIRRDGLEEVRLRHLVVQFEGNLVSEAEGEAAHRAREDAMLLAEQALAALESGETFDAVAARASDGPMALRGADLGWFLRGELGPAFDEAAFSLAPGDWSPIVETPFGLHIIQRVE